MIPRDELEFWQEAEERSEEARALDQVAQPPEPSDEEKAFHERLRDEAEEMKASCPTLWNVLQEKTRPDARLGIRLMSPSTAMSFGEQAAFQFGQDSIGVWLRTLAQESGDG